MSLSFSSIHAVLRNKSSNAKNQLPEQAPRDGHFEVTVLKLLLIFLIISAIDTWYCTGTGTGMVPWFQVPIPLNLVLFTTVVLKITTPKKIIR